MKKIIFLLLLLLLIFIIDVSLLFKGVLLVLLVILSFIVLVFNEIGKSSWKTRADSPSFKQTEKHHRKSGTLKTWEDFTKNPEATKIPPLDQYKEPTITKKMVSDFVLFAKKIKLSANEDNALPFKKLSDLDFQSLDWGDINLEFQLNADVINKWWGDITIEEYGFTETAYTLYGEEITIPFEGALEQDNYKGIITILDKNFLASCGYSDKHNTIKLASDKDCCLEIEEWDTNGEPSQSVEDSYHFYHGPETFEPSLDMIGPEFYHDKINASEVFEPSPMEGNLGYVGIKNLELDIPLIEVSINDQKIDFIFTDKNELKHLLVLLISSYDKEIAKLVDQKLNNKAN